MTSWYQHTLEALQLNGKGPRTQEAYVRAVRMLADFYSKPPAEVTEAELQAYFLHRKNSSHWSPNTMRICYCGIRFYAVCPHTPQPRLSLYRVFLRTAIAGSPMPGSLRYRQPTRHDSCPSGQRCKRPVCAATPSHLALFAGTLAQAPPSQSPVSGPRSQRAFGAHGPISHGQSLRTGGVSPGQDRRRHP